MLYGNAVCTRSKSSARRKCAAAPLDGLRSFAEDHPVAKTRLLHGGHKAGHRDGVRLLPIEQGLAELAAAR